MKANPLVAPPEVASIEVVTAMGQPDPERICTGIVERSNVSTRASVRRFTRLACFQQKVGEQLDSGRAVVHVLQLLPGPQVAARHARDWLQESRIGSGGLQSYWPSFSNVIRSFWSARSASGLSLRHRYHAGMRFLTSEYFQ